MLVSQHHFEQRDQASRALALAIVRQLTDQLTSSPAATLVVSGGSSPLKVLNQLSRTPLPWSQIHVLPSDERIVDLSDAASNGGMIRRELAIGRASEIRLVDIQRDNAEQILAGLPRPVTHVMLGMGDDGHTASLFPDAPQLSDALDSERALMKISPPGAEHQRITLTPRWLLNARRVSLLIFGEAKRAVLERALQPGPVARLPVRSVLHQSRVAVDVYWSK